MITGSPLHTGRGLLSFLAPTPRCSAFCTRPVGRVCQAREQEELGARLRVGGLPQACQFYVNTHTEAKLQPPGPALGPLFRKPSAFVEPTLRGCFSVCPTRSCLKTQGKAGPWGRRKAGGSPSPLTRRHMGLGGKVCLLRAGPGVAPWHSSESSWYAACVCTCV